MELRSGEMVQIHSVGIHPIPWNTAQVCPLNIDTLFAPGSPTHVSEIILSPSGGSFPLDAFDPATVAIHHISYYRLAYTEYQTKD